MILEVLQDRKVHLQKTLENIQQSFHVVTGHLNEVNFQIENLLKDAHEVANEIEKVIE